MKIKCILPIVGLLVFFACKKDPIPPNPTSIVMPPLTHQGLNTFGCYLDGELFVAGGGNSYWDLPRVSGSFDESTKEFGLQATRYINGEVEVSEYIKIRSFVDSSNTTYDYAFNEEDGSQGYQNWGGDRCDYYYQNVPDLGRLTITYLNKETNIISGTFYMNLINEDCEDGDTIMKITDGRFDMKY